MDQICNTSNKSNYLVEDDDAELASVLVYCNADEVLPLLDGADEFDAGVDYGSVCSGTFHEVGC